MLTAMVSALYQLLTDMGFLSMSKVCTDHFIAIKIPDLSVTQMYSQNMAESIIPIQHM